jgi:hypothetical protein
MTLGVQAVSVMRGHWGHEHLVGPLPGARYGQVVAYEFELPHSYEPWPGRTLTERTFVLLQFGVSFATPCWVRHTRQDGTVVDRTLECRDSVAVAGATYTVRDLYVDVVVPVDGRHYRMLDLDEFADALASGVLGVEEAADALRRWQRFLDRHLHAPREPIGAWTDFPPRPCSNSRPSDLQQTRRSPGAQSRKPLPAWLSSHSE